MNFKKTTIAFTSLFIMLTMADTKPLTDFERQKIQTKIKVPAPNTPERIISEYIVYHKLFHHKNLKKLKTRCLNIPSYGADAIIGNLSSPLSWRFDFLVHQKDDRKQDSITQLNRYIALGFLKKTKLTALIDNKQQQVNRYQLTDKGWQATGYGRKNGCFLVGDIGYRNVTKMEIVNKFPEQKIYKITAHFALDPELPDWAKSPEIMKIKGIQKDLTGADHTLLFIKINGEYYCIKDASSLSEVLVDFQGKWQKYHIVKKAIKQHSASHKINYSPEIQQEITRIKNAKPVTIDEINKYLQDTHEKDLWPYFCMNLPGASSKIPVDKRFNSDGFSIAIFKDKNLRGYSVTEKTLPYVKKLERLGVLKYTGEKLIKKRTKGKSDKYPADTYTLSDDYANQLIQDTYCLSLGKTTVKIIDSYIYEDVFQIPSYKYKIKLLKKNPPSWTKNPKLAEWTELKNILKYGKACHGDYRYDLVKRQSSGGAASCWLAYDSIENK